MTTGLLLLLATTWQTDFDTALKAAAARHPRAPARGYIEAAIKAVQAN